MCFVLYLEKTADLFGVYNMGSSVLLLASIQLFFFHFPKTSQKNGINVLSEMT